MIRQRYAPSSIILSTSNGQHSVVATVDIAIPATAGAVYGVLEIERPSRHQCDVHDISFLADFAKMLAEAIITATGIKALRMLAHAKDLMAKDLQHRVRNNLQLIVSLLDNFARTTADGAARQGINRIARRVITLAQVYDSLLGIGLSQRVDLADYLRSLCVNLPELQADRVRPVQLVFHAESVSLDLDRVTSLGMAVAELITNSYGHAFPDRHGLGLVRQLMGRIGGMLKVQSGDGTSRVLAFPESVPSDDIKAAA